MNSRHGKENENLCKKKIKFSKMSAMLYAGAYGCGNIVFLGTWVLGLFFVTKKLITLVNTSIPQTTTARNTEAATSLVQ